MNSLHHSWESIETSKSESSSERTGSKLMSEDEILNASSGSEIVTSGIFSQLMHLQPGQQKPLFNLDFLHLHRLEIQPVLHEQPLVYQFTVCSTFCKFCSVSQTHSKPRYEEIFQPKSVSEERIIKFDEACDQNLKTQHDRSQCNFRASAFGIISTSD